MTGWLVERACLVACRFGDESQQSVAPHAWHVRRCTQDAPIFTHASHSRRPGRFTSSTAAMCEHDSAMAKERIMGTVEPVPSERTASMPLAASGHGASNDWPELPSSWNDTYATVH